ncbi:MAG: FCD domain-containing protein [Sphingomicrobium sp.]
MPFAALQARGEARKEGAAGRGSAAAPPVDEHELVLGALRERDPDAARKLMRDHLANVTQNLLVATEEDARDRARLKVEERRFDFARRAGVKI